MAENPLNRENIIKRELIRSLFFSKKKDKEAESALNNSLLLLWGFKKTGWEKTGDISSLKKILLVSHSIVSCFTPREIEQNRPALEKFLNDVLPDVYKKLDGFLLTSSCLLYLGGYRPPGGKRDLDFWFGLNEPRSSKLIIPLCPFALFVLLSREDEFGGASFISPLDDEAGSFRGLFNSSAIPNPEVIPPDEEEALWEILAANYFIISPPEGDKWKTVADQVSACYEYAATTLKTGGCNPLPNSGGRFTPISFLSLPSSREDGTILERLAKSRVSMDTNGRTLVQKIPGSGKTVFEVYYKALEKKWENDSSNNVSFKNINVLNYTTGSAGKSIYLEYINPNTNSAKFYWMGERGNGGNTFIARWGRIGAVGQSKEYPMHQWKDKLQEKLKKRYVQKQNMGEYETFDYSSIFSKSAFILAQSLALGALAVRTELEYLRGEPLPLIEKLASDGIKALSFAPVYKGRIQGFDLVTQGRKGFPCYSERAIRSLAASVETTMSLDDKDARVRSASWFLPLLAELKELKDGNVRKDDVISSVLLQEQVPSVLSEVDPEYLANSLINNLLLKEQEEQDGEQNINNAPGFEVF